MPDLVKRKASSLRYAQRNRKKLAAKSRRYYRLNRERLRKEARERTKADPEKSKAVNRRHHAKHREARNAASRLRYKRNRDKILAQAKRHREENLEMFLERGRRYYWKAPEKGRLYTQAWREKHPGKATRYSVEYARIKRVEDPYFRLKDNLRARLRLALKGELKAATTRELIGCDVGTLRSYLESKFKPGMSWENHGRRGWHMDHIIPCASFDLSDPMQQRKCFHYTNLQPLWAKENLLKGDSYGDVPSDLVRRRNVLGATKACQELAVSA